MYCFELQHIIRRGTFKDDRLYASASLNINVLQQYLIIYDYKLFGMAYKKALC